MFRRYREWRAEYAERLARATAAGKAEGLEQGRAEGMAEGRTQAYQAIAAWNARRLEAEAKGLPFDEPPPGNGTAT